MKKKIQIQENIIIIFTLKFLEHSYQVTDFIKFDVNESLKEKFLKLSKEIIENADNILNNKILK